MTTDRTYQPITPDAGWFVGEDQAMQFTISDASGAAQNLTGWTITFKMAATQGGTAVLTKTATLTTPLSGIATVTSSAAETSAFAAGTYYYALSRTDSGFNGVLAQGPAVLRGRPT